jgi:D-beta-D-heptose 7-phosphate kinase/D-beta-D-heptose 1-phosphate adenosyltransferase
MTSTDLASLIRYLPGTTVMVVGDLMLDEYIWGDVRRISPEAPVPVVEVGRHTSVPGGAANAALGIVALGGKVMLGGLVGADGAAQRLRDALKDRGIGSDGLIVNPERPTTTKSRIVAGSQQVVRADVESCDPPDGELEEDLLRWIGKEAAAADAVIVSDYAKGVVTARLAQGAIAAANARHIPVVVDPKGIDFSKYRGATVVTPNLSEAERIAGLTIGDERSLYLAGQALAVQLGESAVLVTRGARGMSLLMPGANSHPVHIAAAARNVFDVTGAGDTVAAAVALALASGASLADAARLATVAAGIVVGKVGTSTVTQDELLAEVRR